MSCRTCEVVRGPAEAVVEAAEAVMIDDDGAVDLGGAGDTGLTHPFGAGLGTRWSR